MDRGIEVYAKGDVYKVELEASFDLGCFLPSLRLRLVLGISMIRLYR